MQQAYQQALLESAKIGKADNAIAQNNGLIGENDVGQTRNHSYKIYFQI